MRMRCPCGGRHQLDGTMVGLIERHGRTVRVATAFGTWDVPRVYVAVHMPADDALPGLADQYGWTQPTDATPPPLRLGGHITKRPPPGTH